MDWALACEPKGCWFDFQSGHMPGLQARSPVGGAWEATTHWCFPSSLSPSLPLCLKINKIKIFNKKANNHSHPLSNELDIYFRGKCISFPMTLTGMGSLHFSALFWIVDIAFLDFEILYNSVMNLFYDLYVIFFNGNINDFSSSLSYLCFVGIWLGDCYLSCPF